MASDRQAVKNPLEDWVISDKDLLIAWVRRFLWHYEGICAGEGTEKAPDMPEVTIVENIHKVFGIEDSVDRMQIVPTCLKDPEYYFQPQDNRG